MRCRDALRALLEAEPQELRGEGESAVAAHVRMCPECGMAADALLAGEESLAETLRGQAPPLDVKSVLERARSADEESVRLPFPPPSRPRWRSAAWKSVVPLAAAAATAFLLLTRDGGIPPVTPVSEPAVITTAQVLEAPEGKNVAVLETQNPAIAVVWFF
jgi:hypothetical protein